MSVYLGNQFANSYSNSYLSHPRLSYQNLQNFGNFQNKKLRLNNAVSLNTTYNSRQNNNFFTKKNFSPSPKLRSPKSKSISSSSYYSTSFNKNSSNNLNLIENLQKSNFNIEEIIYTNNLDPIEKNLNILIFSEFSHENSEVTKIVKTFQNITEYLLDIQTNLESETNQYENDYDKLKNDSEFLEEELKKNKILIQQYKNKSRVIKNRMRMYKKVIPMSGVGAGATPKSLISSGHKIYFFCNLCPDKKFSSPKKLVEHTERRHNGENKNSGDNFNANFNENLNDFDNRQSLIVENLIETKISKFKEEIQNSLTNFHKENLNHLIENQNNIEKKIEQLKSSSFNTAENFNVNSNIIIPSNEEAKESTRGKILENEITEEKLKNIIEKINRINSTAVLTSNNMANINMTNSLPNNINDIILKMSNTQNERINIITEELGKFKENILTEIKEIKSSSNVNVDNKSYINRRPSEISEIKPVHNNDIQIIQMGTPSKNSKNILDDIESKNALITTVNKASALGENHRPSLEIKLEEKEKIFTERNNSIFIPTESVDNNQGNIDNVLPSNNIINPSRASAKVMTIGSLEETVYKEDDNNNINVINTSTNQADVKLVNYNKMKNLFASFINRDEKKLFSNAMNNPINKSTISPNNSKQEKFIYSTVPEMEIVINDQTKLKLELDTLFTKNNNSELNEDSDDDGIDEKKTCNTGNINLDKLRELKTSKKLFKIVGSIYNKTEEQSNKFDYYKEYMENIYKVLDVKSFLFDEKVLASGKGERYFNKMSGNSLDKSNRSVKEEVNDKNSVKSNKSNKENKENSNSVKSNKISNNNKVLNIPKIPLPSPSLFNQNTIQNKLSKSHTINSKESSSKNKLATPQFAQSTNTIPLKETIETKGTAKFNEVIDIEDEFDH
jgi:hypothetical protein